MNFWLDDVRPAPEGWFWAKTVPELIDAIADAKLAGKEIWKVSLDNDLGCGEIKGYKYLDYLEEMHEVGLTHLIPEKVNIHSANPVARERMQKVINRIYGE